MRTSLDDSSTVTASSRPGITDRFKQWSDKFFYTLSPSYGRWHTLNFRVFRKSNLSDFRGPRIFLCAADLNSGYEIIFSEKMLCKLHKTVIQTLWKNYEGDFFGSLGEGKDIAVATAVAASSAYPPFFSSVPVIIKKKLIANCIDGGVIDNHAVAVAWLMAKYVIDPERFVGGWTFSRTIGRVLVLDASAPMRPYQRHYWSRLCTLLRLADVLHHRQVEDAEEAADDIGRMFNVPAAGIGLRVLPRDDCVLTNPEIAQLAARVRTHFDPFSKVACAVLAYLGYYWANQWAIEDFLGRKPPKPRSPSNVPMRGIGDILPTRFAPPATMLTDSEMLAHLRYSHLRFRPWRWLRRRIARKFPFRR